MSGTTHPSEELPALLDGELQGAARQGVEAHLASCRSCSEELALLKGALAALAAAPAPLTPSADLRRRVLTQVAQEPARSSLRSWLRAALTPRRAVPLFAAGALAALLVVGLPGRHEAGGLLGEELELATHLGLLEDYDVVEGLPENLSAEDLSVVAHLDELER